MTKTCEGRPRGDAASPIDLAFPGGNDHQDKTPNPAATQVTNSRAIREATIASILDESAYLLGGLTVHASIAQQYAELGDARGFLYSLDRVVEQAIRTGAEGIELRKIRKEMREARR
jgi:hypothetical protein